MEPKTNNMEKFVMQILTESSDFQISPTRKETKFLSSILLIDPHKCACQITSHFVQQL